MWHGVTWMRRPSRRPPSTGSGGAASRRLLPAWGSACGHSDPAMAFCRPASQADISPELSPIPAQRVRRASVAHNRWLSSSHQHAGVRRGLSVVGQRGRSHGRSTGIWRLDSLRAVLLPRSLSAWACHLEGTWSVGLLSPPQQGAITAIECLVLRVFLTLVALTGMLQF